VKRAGTDLTIVAHGRPVINALKAAQLLEAEHDVSVEVVDLRSIRPLDEDTVLGSVRKTHGYWWSRRTSPFAESAPNWLI